MKNRFAAGLLTFALFVLALLFLFSVFQGERVQPHVPTEYNTVQR